MTEYMEKANQALARLDGYTKLLPNVSLFNYLFVRKEALLSSQIEGTQSSLSDLILFESHEKPGVPIEDVEEVSNYIFALNYGLKRISDDFPISLRLIKEIHAKLLARGRGENRSPGEFRRSQNWIGGSRPGNAMFVPPPPEYVMDCMGALEKFIHDDTTHIPTLIKAALMHVQFETIHPFLDGNGRLGRLLITLLLCAEGVLQDPTLYLSLYFKANRMQYYHLLQSVREKGNWEDWLKYFMYGVLESSEQAVVTIQRLQKCIEQNDSMIVKLGRASRKAHEAHQCLQRKPVISVTDLSKELDVSFTAGNKIMQRLEDLGMVVEISDRKRDRLYSYTQYIDILNEGAEPIINHA